MPDHRLPLQFGLSVTPATSEINAIERLTDVADTTGLDLIAIQDHPYNSTFLDTWSLMAFLAARTNQIRFYPSVADLAMRPPAMLAKAAASLDQLSGGRVELGIGAGAFWDAIAAMGGPRRSPAEAVDATEEAMRIIRLVWGADPSVSFEGQHYHLRGHQPGPQPAHDMELWLGAVKPRMLRLTGRLADGWVAPLSVYLPPQAVSAAQATIDEGARRAGRAPSNIRRIYNVVGGIDTGLAGRSGLVGSVDDWVEALAGWTTELGFDTFIFWPTVASIEQVERFATEIVPRTRARVSERRAAVH